MDPGPSAPDLFTLDPPTRRFISTSDPPRVLGQVSGTNLLDPGFAPDRRVAGGRLIVRLGTGRAGISWGPAAWSGFNTTCAALAPRMGEGLRLCLWPDASGVLSDAPSTLAWLDRDAPAGFEVLLDPAAWLTPAMRPHARDHVDRMVEQLAAHRRVAGVVLPAHPGTGDPLADQIAKAVGALGGPSLPLLVASPA